MAGAREALALVFGVVGFVLAGGTLLCLYLVHVLLDEPSPYTAVHRKGP